MKQEINLNRNAEIRFLLDFPIHTPKIARKCSEKNELGTQDFKNSKRVSRETDERRDSVAERGRESRRRSGEEG